MTVQNEPEYAAPWEACVYTAEQVSHFSSTMHCDFYQFLWNRNVILFVIIWVRC
jgi:O-glycosyl hydrolase